MNKNVLSIFCLFVALAACQTRVAHTAHKTVKGQGVEINYRVAGHGDTTLLFVHGWGINQSYWDGQVRYFSKKYKVVTFDLPGFGQSVPPEEKPGKSRKNWGMAAYGDDVAALIKKLKLENVVLIGHSMGGNIILEAAVNHPKHVIGFIGIDNFKDLGMEYSEADKMEINKFFDGIKENYANVAAAYSEGALFSENTDTTVINRVIHDIRSANPEVAIASLEDAIWATDREKQLMGRLKLKVLLVNSDEVPTNEIALKKYCGAYEIIPLHGTGHYPMVERPVEFNRALQRAIDAL